MPVRRLTPNGPRPLRLTSTSLRPVPSCFDPSRFRSDLFPVPSRSCPGLVRASSPLRSSDVPIPFHSCSVRPGSVSFSPVPSRFRLGSVSVLSRFRPDFVPVTTRLRPTSVHPRSVPTNSGFVPSHPSPLPVSSQFRPGSVPDSFGGIGRGGGGVGKAQMNARSGGRQ